MQLEVDFGDCVASGTPLSVSTDLPSLVQTFSIHSRDMPRRQCSKWHLLRHYFYPACFTDHSADTVWSTNWPTELWWIESGRALFIIKSYTQYTTQRM